MTRCAESAAGEPLAGTAPRARWWWLIEVPGPWGARAVDDCRIPAVRTLSSDEQRRILLIRKPGRHPASSDSPLRVWIAGGTAGDPPTRLAIADAPDDLGDWPLEGPASAIVDPDAPVLAVCTNSSRDLCCGIDGRALVRQLAGLPGVWECSHLGGHRFAPTALHVPSGLVYGRLPEDAARTLVTDGPDDRTLPWLRGRSALEEPAQVAEIDLRRRGVALNPHEPRVDVVDDEAVVTFSGTAPVLLKRTQGADRLASCGAEPEAASTWRMVSSP